MLFPVGEEPLASLSRPFVVHVFSSCNQLKVYEIVGAFASFFARPVELLRYLMMNGHQGNRFRFRKSESLEESRGIFRNDHIGLFGIADLVVPDFKPYRDPGFSKVGQLDELSRRFLLFGLFIASS